jgi:hypothetical protein
VRAAAHSWVVRCIGEMSGYRLCVVRTLRADSATSGLGFITSVISNLGEICGKFVFSKERSKFIEI